MKKRQNFVLFGILILIFSMGCSDEKENKNLVKKNISSNNDDDIKLIKELSSISTSKIVYSINNKNYGIDSLPKTYIKLEGKARKVFLDFYIKYNLTLDSLKEEEREYKEILDKKIKIESDKIIYRGINQNELDKILYMQLLKLEQIAIEEVAKKEQNLTERIEKVYKKNQDKFKYPDTVELSFIVFKDNKKAVNILSEMGVKKINITEFSSFVKKNSVDTKSRLTSGYAGYMTEKSAGLKLFNDIWKQNNLGLIRKVLERDGKYLLVFIHKKIQAGERSLSDVSDQIKEKLLYKKRNIWISKLYQKNIKTKKVTIYDSFENNQTFY